MNVTPERGEQGGLLYALSGDWTQIAPGVQVRLKDAPNEEGMTETVILEVAAAAGAKCIMCSGRGQVLRLGEWVACPVCNGRGVIVGSRR